MFFDTTEKKVHISIDIEESVYNAFINKTNKINEDKNDVISQLMRDYVFSSTESETSILQKDNRKYRKDRARSLANQNGFSSYRLISYAKWDEQQKYYTNIAPDKINTEGLILLDDIANSKLHVLLIPRNALHSFMFKSRADNGNLDIHISKDFIDTTSKGTHVDFKKFYKTTIPYTNDNVFESDISPIQSERRTFNHGYSLEGFIQKWLDKKTGPYFVLKAYFAILDKFGENGVIYGMMQRYALEKLHNTNFQPTFASMKNGIPNVSPYRIFNIENHYGSKIVKLTDETKDILLNYKTEFFK